MSASEKLKALDVRWWKDHDEAHRVFNALPQIVAVVEAAEDLQRPPHDERDEWTLQDTDDLRAVVAALSALEEALS